MGVFYNGTTERNDNGTIAIIWHDIEIKNETTTHTIQQNRTGKRDTFQNPNQQNENQNETIAKRMWQNEA